MKIFGLDFTSAPTRQKPITCAVCELTDNHLHILDCVSISTFTGFEAFLRSPGPWLAALDFPFGQPKKLIANLHWPQTWIDYIQIISAMSKTEFEQTLLNYQKNRLTGDKQHLRATDKYAEARSPMMLHRVPIGKMFFQGVPRLLASGVSILPCHPTSDNRIVVEGYPGLVARKWIGKRSYKSDERSKQTLDKEDARRSIVRGLRSSELTAHYDVTLELSDAIADVLVLDPTGDKLDAVLCAVQAVWVYTRRDDGYGIPEGCNKDEGWIVDPGIVSNMK